MPEMNNYIIWFRPEVIEEVSWGGNPVKGKQEYEDNVRLSPRKSFKKWTEVVKNTSTSWKSHEIDIALALRNDLKESIFKKYKEVQAFNDELTQAYKELESFSYSVSHDLRAPLRNINGFAQIIMEDYNDKLDDYGKSVVHTILKSTDHMNDLIDAILSFSKIGQTGLRINELDLKKIVNAEIEELMLLKEYRNSNIQFRIQPDLPLVYADAKMFGQVVHNLISNAVKYSSKEAQAIIEVGGTATEEKIQFFVKDNGIGFDMEYKDQIFKVFTRLVGEGKFKGNGVGLAIVKRVVDKHNGSIDVHSKKGVGTTFIIELPIFKNND